MNRQFKNLIICITALVVLVGIVICAISWDGVKEEIVDGESIVLWENDRANIESISLQTSEEIINFLVTEDEVEVEALENLPLSQSAVSAIVNYATNLQATEEIKAEQPIDLSIYGLDNPITTFTVGLKDGTTYNILIGNQTPTTAGNYAFFNDKIYAVSSSVTTTFNKTLYDFVSDEIVPSKEAEAYIEKITLKNINQPEINLMYIPEEIIIEEIAEEDTSEEDTSEEDTSEEGIDNQEIDDKEVSEEESETTKETIIPAYYKMEAPYALDLTSYDVTSWAESIFNMRADTIERIAVDQKQREAFGLNHPISVLRVETSDAKVHELTVSKIDDKYYMTYNEVPIIYGIGEEALSFINISPEVLVGSVFNTRKSEELAKIQIETNMESFEIIGNKGEITAEEFEEIGNAILNFPITKETATQEFKFEAAAKIIMTYKDGKKDILELIPTGTGNLYMLLNGVCEYTTNEWSLNNLIEKYHTANEKEEVVTNE